MLPINLPIATENKLGIFLKYILVMYIANHLSGLAVKDSLCLRQL